MNGQTKNDKALPGLAALHMPLQAAPIDRTESPGALAGTPGVEADLKFARPPRDLIITAPPWFWPRPRTAAPVQRPHPFPFQD